MEDNEENPFGEVIFTYTEDEAMQDGILFYLFTVNPDWQDGLFSHVTMNLMRKGYKTEEELNLPNLLDLLNQVNQIVKKASNDFKNPMDWFYHGHIELPSGEKQQIYIQQNATGRYTIMLPEDY